MRAAVGKEPKFSSFKCSSNILSGESSNDVKRKEQSEILERSIRKNRLTLHTLNKHTFRYLKT
jgi:hypothetical protein